MSNPQYTATGYPAPHAASHAAGGYPYAAPPPHPTHYSNAPNPNPNAYYTAPYGTAQRATFYRRFMVAIVSFMVILATILFIIWIVLRPKVPDFRINSLSLSQFNVSSSSSGLSGNWTASFAVSNPNSKLHVYYDELEGAVFYKSELLASNRLPPFDQATKTQRNLTATLVAASAYVDGWVVSDINGDRGHGSVKFNLKIIATVHFKSGGWWSRKRYLRVFCDGLPVGISSNSAIGTLTGGPRDCAVGVAAWF